MVCRVCEEVILGENKYCPYCGWSNGSIEVANDKIYFVKQRASEEAVEYVNVKHSGKASVKVKFNIIKNDFIYFENNTQQIDIEIDKDLRIPIYIKSSYAENYESVKSFVIEIESNDFNPGDKLIKREYKNKDIFRKFSKQIELVLAEPKRLKFSRNFIVFNKVNKSADIIISNPNEQDVKIEKYKKEKAVIEFAGLPIISKGDKTKIMVKYSGEKLPQTDFFKTEIIYKIGNVDFIETIYFYICEPEDENGKVGYDNIVAIDFGTSKTTGAYINLNEEKPEIRNLAEIPSSMAYMRGKIPLIGPNAEDKSETAEYIDRIKTHLREDNIIFRNTATNESIPRPSFNVLVDFFKEFKKEYLKDILKIDGGFDARNKYIFTLPILDSSEDSNGNLFEKQEAITRKSAQKVFKNEYFKDDDVHVLKESEAAMFSIIDIIKKHDKGWRNIRLNIDDIICIFDYGAGTLDISFGKFLIKNKGIPTFDIEKKANIGLYKKENSENPVTLGGDVIDDCMLEEFLTANDIEIIDSPIYGKIVSDDSSYSKVEFVNLKKAVRTAKIELSKSWDDLDKDGQPVEPDEYIGEILNFKKSDFERIIDDDINAAIEAMREAMKLADIEPKYIFLVGGSSLLKEIKVKMSEEFGEEKIYSPYDYACEEYENEDDEEIYEKIRYTAVHAVARGAVLSYLTKFSNIINFDIDITSENPQDEINNMFKFKKGESIPTETRPFSIQLSPGKHTLNINAYIKNTNYILGMADIDVQDNGTGVQIKMTINERRNLNLEYKIGKTGDFQIANKFDIIV